MTSCVASGDGGFQSSPHPLARDPGPSEHAGREDHSRGDAERNGLVQASEAFLGIVAVLGTEVAGY